MVIRPGKLRPSKIDLKNYMKMNAELINSENKAREGLIKFKNVMIIGVLSIVVIGFIGN
jgi:hypothetical protein